MTARGIAIVGMACRYPEAASPAELWDNVLAQRRAFRRIPSVRLRAEDYLSADRGAPDRTYAATAAVLEGWEFDRVRHRVAGRTFRAADLAHWLALDVAEQALADAGFPGAAGLGRDAAGVVLGNTLTGEFSRANVLRLRWPYVRRVVESGLADLAWTPEDRRTFLSRLERAYKEPFPEVNEESLAGGLSNTIAGRICNAFDLHGGGYTVDGACSASLLAVITACNHLVLGDLDVALAGGVDLSLDPFEIVGFAKTGALAPDLMRIYDARSAGFWPGEGCGMVVLMRHEDAVAQGRRVLAVIRGWGVSSDGTGGLTRPEADGQSLALARAYRRAGFDAGTVSYFEGHGTGTEVGDATELRVLARAHGPGEPAALGSIKANIGHTKAAAGVAGLLKATLALHHEILPPTTGCETPHPVLRENARALRILRTAELWPADRPRRAGVSAMGFGGINTHVILEGAAPAARRGLDARERALAASAQDAELFVFAAPDPAALRAAIDRVLAVAPGLALSELRDVAAWLSPATGPWRAAVVAGRPEELVRGLEQARAWCEEGVSRRIDPSGVFLARAGTPRVVYLFPGQGSPSHLGGGAWRWRFQEVASRYENAGLPEDGDGVDTRIAQPAICLASLAALGILDRLGLVAEAAVGHSLGELTALHWGGAMDGDALLRIARARGAAMATLGAATGAMAGLRASGDDVQSLLAGTGVTVAGLNGPQQTVVSGERDQVEAVLARGRARGVAGALLPVSHAFHSPLVAAAAGPLVEHLSTETLRPLRRSVMSTVTGEALGTDADLIDLLRRQVTEPVRFREALSAAARDADLLVEVGPGHTLSALAALNVDVPAVTTDAAGAGLRGLLEVVGAAWVLGAPVRLAALFEDRVVRPYDPDRPRVYLANPCEAAPVGESGAEETPRPAVETATAETLDAVPLDLVRALVAERAELPLSAIGDEHRLLGDLRLNSIVVGQVAAEAARRLGLPPPAAPTEFASATVAEMAKALEEMRDRAPGAAEETAFPPGVDAWVHAFETVFVERARPAPVPPVAPGLWQVLAPAAHPLAEALRQAAATFPGSGVVLCLPEAPDETSVPMLLEAAHTFLARREGRLCVVQQGGGGGALARTAHLESGGRPTTVVDLPFDHPDAAAWVRAEIEATRDFLEAHIDAAGCRREAVVRPLAVGDGAGELPLGPEDVLLVTGGGKGIAAEAALAVAQASGARLALLGRSAPERDAALAANLSRLQAREVRFLYVPCDVRRADDVAAAVATVERELGPVTAVLHGAGVNTPRLLEHLDEDAFLATLAPKLGGARHVLAALDPARLKLFVALGSIIARTGLPGEADYGTANDWLGALVEAQARRHPQGRWLCAEFSVWSSVGMGERLGRIEALAREGVMAIPPEEGVAQLLDLVRRAVQGRVIVSSRWGRSRTLSVAGDELPFLRFLERPRVWVPGVELVADVDLTSVSDPYLLDHVFGGERIFPAVLGLEAMAQGVRAVTGRSPRVFEHVRFHRPIVVSGEEPRTVRLAVLVRDADRVDVVLRSAETGFAVNHFEATCRLRAASEEPRAFAAMDAGAAPVSLDPERDLYGGLFFQAGRFRRVARYRRLAARACVAELRPPEATSWFGPYLPPTLLLGDPGARDAAIHAIQACIPHHTILPVGVDRVEIHDAEARPAVVRAEERRQDGATFWYDLEVTAEDGTLCERWIGLELRAVERNEGAVRHPSPLLGPYFERRLADLLPDARLTVVVENGDGDREERRTRALHRALGADLPLHRRPDGRPEITDPRRISVSHSDPLTLLAVSASRVGCDVESGPNTRGDASGLLDAAGRDLARVIAGAAREEEGVAALRVWTVLESLKKAGHAPGTPIVLSRAEPDGWVLLGAGRSTAATWAAADPTGSDGLVVGFLVTPPES